MRLAAVRRLTRTRRLMRARTFVGRKEDVTAIKKRILG
jgi:hypothetical protein